MAVWPIGQKCRRVLTEMSHFTAGQASSGTRRQRCSMEHIAMGIRFYCPNGHKLNVKEFQAGRKGICPYCGAKIQIPTKSTRPSSKQTKAEKEAAVHTEDAMPVAEPPPVTARQAEPAAVTSPPETPETPAVTDPLDEAGDVVWYVRPAGGGQFGPATSDIMRHWIDEGRVSPDSLVWREGWRDWKAASDVFPTLR